MMDGFEANLLANLFQIATLALGVCLLAVWINYLKAGRDRTSRQEQDCDSTDAGPGSEYGGALRR
jgi:hypothetical protein